MMSKHNTTIGYGWKLAMGIGLVGATAVLLAASAFADRASTPMTAASLHPPAGSRTLVADLASAVGFGRVVTPMQSFPLGIDAPQGVNLRDLPRGLSDYIRPSSNTPVIHTQLSPLGIDLPQGAHVRTLPRGLTDYLRPQPTVQADMTLGITLPYGADIHALPAGFRDYIRADARPAPAAAASVVLGIDLPYGAIRAELTDYLRPAQTATHTLVPAVSSVLGITLPSGTNASDLPAGIRDYLRSDQWR